MRFALKPALLISLFVFGCEDGPEQLFVPNEGDPMEQNGYRPEPPWVQPGRKGFDDGEAGGDAAGRARFCDENEKTKLVEWMVKQPIIPDVSVGGIPLWTPEGTPIYADDLLGKPNADYETTGVPGKFCDPDEVYVDAFVWGPLLEVIVLFDQETRLVERVIGYTQYLGKLEGSYTDPVRGQVPITIGLRDRVKIGTRELDEYTSSDDQDSRKNSWANHDNVNKIYRMLRETFFDAAPFPDTYDCVAENICDISYTANDQSVPQDLWVVFTDTDLQVSFSPDGFVQVVNSGPVRFAPFELKGQMQFADTTAATDLDFKFESDSSAGCQFSLTEKLSFADFKTRCIDSERTISRVNYVVHTARDGVDIEFNGLDLSFMRKLSQHDVLGDGERPGEDDTLYAMFFTRSLDAPVEEFRAGTIGGFYKTKLEARLQDAVSGTSTATHPLANYSLSVPFPFNDPVRIGELTTLAGDSWIPQVVEEVQTIYNNLTPAQKAVTDPRVADPIFLIEPFVAAVLQSFSHGNSENADTYKVFWSTDDRQWVIGEVHFLQNGELWRIQAQYSLNFNGISAVSVSHGYSEIDQIYNGVNQSLHNGAQPFYTIYDSMVGATPYALGGNGITITGFDRQLDTLDAEVTMMGPSGSSTVAMVLAGNPKEDRNGFYRQIRGERYEFVPADIVYLYGKETVMEFYVDDTGTIAGIAQGRYKGQVPLCEGLWVGFGDDVPALLDAWTNQNGIDAHRECEIIFNYSENGNVLYEIVSLRNKVGISVDNGKATTVSVWQ